MTFDNDLLWGDSSVLKDTPPEFAGQDYLDGGAGDDQLVGGSRRPTFPSQKNVANDFLWRINA